MRSAGESAATRPSRFLGRTLGTGRELRRRLLLHHVPLAAISALGLALYVIFSPSHDGISLSRFVVGTAYLGLVLLGVTLLVGPVNLLLRRRNPVSSYLRRDVGVWTALVSIVHVILGFGVLLSHTGSSLVHLLGLFVKNGKPVMDRIGLGNWTGLAATLIVVGLLVLSTDRSLSELKARRWKTLQRLNYVLFVFVVVHAVFYGSLAHGNTPSAVVLVSTVVAVLLGQAAGILLWRRRHLSAPA